MKQLVPLATVLIGACAMTYDAVKVGPGTYQSSAVASPARGGISGAQALAMKAANKQCAALGKSINVVNTETGHEFPAAGRAIVTFKCE